MIDLQHLGTSPDLISQLARGSHPYSATLKQAKKPMVILGADQLTRKDGAQILAETQALAKALGDNSKVLANSISLSSFLTNVGFTRLRKNGKS